MKFQLETIKNILEEAKPLLVDHWNEVAHFKDIPLDPDYDSYLKIEEAGMSKTFTARTDDGTLVGYAVFFVRPHIHYRSMVMAQQDIVYVDAAHRPSSILFFDYCDMELKAMGINVVSQHVKSKHNFGSILERHGYELMDLIYVKRLN